MAEDEISKLAMWSSLGSMGSPLLGSSGSPLVENTEDYLECWKEFTTIMEQLLTEGLQKLLTTKIRQSVSESAVTVSLEALRDNLYRVDNFSHFALGKAPIVVSKL